MTLSRIKLKLFFLIFLGLTGLGFLAAHRFNFSSPAAEAQSGQSDAIAIRVISNPEHVSARVWFRNQDFQGSPQAVIVDGYEGVRDGQTVYVNVANINDKGTEAIADDDLYTNIYLITYTKSSAAQTADIFSKIIKHWKFNTNLDGNGACSGQAADICLIDSDCPIGEYCRGRKARIIRDIKRLESLAVIGEALAIYKESNRRYPTLNSGSYLPHKSVSVWPSWQKVLAQELKLKLPVDPINALGPVPERFNPSSGWDEARKEFAGNLDDPIKPLPDNSLVYVYRSNAKGDWADYCAQLETSYNNIASFGCSEQKIANNPPLIKGVNLSGWPALPFNGLVSALDPDGDKLAFRVELVEPINAADWTGTYKWEWSAGFNNFRIDDTALAGQKRIFAAKSGLASLPGMYRVRITADDQRGEANSVVSGIYDITIASFRMDLSDIDTGIAIGSTETYNITGMDASQNPFNINLSFESADFNGASIANEAELNKYGFTVSGQNLTVFFNKDTAPLQKTGTYTINLSAIDPSTGAKEISSSVVKIKNRPPAIKKIEDAKIPVGNLLTINTLASDPDGHGLNYLLSGAPDGHNLSANLDGVISGTPELILRSYVMDLKVQDDYFAYTIAPYGAGTETGFKLEVYNNPPEFKSIEATYVNGTKELCEPPLGCSFVIDNGENALIRVYAEDKDPGHFPHYELIDTFSAENGGISIDENSGFISGLNNLNLNGLNDKEYQIAVRVHDTYCPGNPPETCSANISFSLKVMRACSVVKSDATYVNSANFASPAVFSLGNGINAPGASSDLMSSLGFPAPTSCSTIGNATADITASGVTKKRAIVFVVDVSGSMDGRNLVLVPEMGWRPIDLAKIALQNLLDDIRLKANDFPAGAEVGVGLVWYGGGVDFHSIGNIKNDVHKWNLNVEIINFWPDMLGDGTNTLGGLQKANEMLNAYAADFSTIVLISDGVPIVAQGGCDPCESCQSPCPCGFEPDCTCNECGPFIPGDPIGCNSKADYKIAFTCPLPGNNACLTIPKVSCCWFNPNHNQTPEINVFTDLIKGVKEIFTVFYNTGLVGGEAAMSAWASDPNATHAFAGADIDQMLDEVSKGLLSSPKSVIINGFLNPGFSNDPSILTQSKLSWTGIGSILSCSASDAPLYATFDDNGTVDLANIKFDYCPALLHY